MRKHQGGEYLNDFDSEEGETNKTTALPNFMPKVLSVDEIADSINSLNSKQREVLNLVHTWTKDYVKYDGHNIELMHVFLSSSRGTGKSHLVKVIYNAISKTLLHHCKDLEKLGVLSLGPTGISAVNIVGTVIHSGLETKSGTKLLDLNDTFKVALRYRLIRLKFLIIDELFTVSSDLWTEIDSSLG